MRRMLFILALAATAIGALPAASAEAGLPVNGRIYFASDRDGDYDIYSILPSGTGLIQLTTHPADDTHPAVSPDGKKIAFARDGVIYVKNANGTGPETPLTSPLQGSARNPTWSPDGKRIAFEAITANHPDHEIYVASAAGFDLFNPQTCCWQRLTWHPASDTDPAWSPDGAKIAFQSYRDGNAEIYVENANFSLFDPTTHGLKRLTNDPAIDWFPAWTPDGSGILFATNRHGGSNAYKQFEIYIMYKEGGGETRVTYTPGADESQPAPAPYCCSFAFVRSYAKINNPHRDREIYTRANMNNDLGEQRLTFSPGDDWSPDWASGFLPFPPVWSEGPR